MENPQTNPTPAEAADVGDGHDLEFCDLVLEERDTPQFNCCGCTTCTCGCTSSTCGVCW